jgi:hypothetical protein
MIATLRIVRCNCLSIGARVRVVVEVQQLLPSCFVVGQTSK